MKKQKPTLVEAPVKKVTRQSKDKFISTTVFVSQDDINASRGYQSCSYRCPVARALIRTFKTGDVSVGTRVVTLTNSYASYNLPEEAQDFIRSFDTGNTTKPFSFTLLKS